MIDQINKLIAINLFLLFASEHDSLSLNDFINEHGDQLPGAKMLAEIMEQKKLITACSPEGTNYKLTELGEHIAKKGGWLKHIDNINKGKNSMIAETKMQKNKAKRPNIELIIAGIIIVFLCFLIVSCI